MHGTIEVSSESCMSISILEKKLAFIFFLLLTLSFFSASTAEAAVTIKRGTATQNIWWQISGPAASCVKGINVISGGPTSGVDVQWQTPPSAPAPSGSIPLGPWNNAGVYDFTCTPVGFPPGVDRITVNDCPFYGEVWGGSACGPAVPATLSITSPTNVTVGGTGTLSWTTTGATSIDINTCSGPAAAAWTQIGINGASLPNGSKPVTATAAMVGVTTCSAVQAFGPGGPSTPQSFMWTVTGASCPLPWGGAPLAHGASVTAYSSPSIVSPGTCASISELRTCTNGVLSGTYANQSCVVTPPGAPFGTLSAASLTCTVLPSGTLCPIDFTLRAQSLLNRRQ